MSQDPIKEALHRLHYGFYSITSRNGDDVNAMVGNWLIQASFEPRLIVFALARKAYTHEVVSAGRVFAVNLFNKDDREAIAPFTKARAKRPDKMDNAVWTPAPLTGCPILEGAAAYIECRVAHLLETGGDHDLLVGEVIGAGILKPGEVTDTLTLPDMGWSYAG